MDEKSILEVAFEWICECGAYEQLKKQCENYAADVSVRYKFSRHAKVVIVSKI